MTSPLFTPIGVLERPKGKVTVAIDLDHTTIAYGDAVEAAAGRLGIRFKPGSGHPTYEMFPIPFETYEDWHASHVDSMTRGDMKLLDHTFPRASAAIRSAGHRLLIVTSREDEYYDSTASMLASHGIEYDELVMTHDKTAQGADVLYDDKPFHLESARDAGMISIRRAWPYNAHVQGVYDAVNTAEIAAWLRA